MLRNVDQKDGLYEDWLETIRREGGQFAWIRLNGLSEMHNRGRTTFQMREAVFSSKRIRDTIGALSAERGEAESVVRSEAQQILSTMALDFRFHSVTQPIGYSLAKIFERIFSHIWVNSAQMCQIREISSDRSVPVVWLPTHRSYLDFLLLSLLSYHYRIQMPAICAADDFRASRLLGEALRRCEFPLNDLLYRSIFAEYVQQLLLHADRPIEFFVEGQRSRTGKSVYPRIGLLQLAVEPFLKAQLYDTILVPVTIDYDRILEQELFAWELIGFSKPRETTMGLLRARSILADHFGDIRVTVGEPISIRKYFSEQFGGFDVRLELANQSSPELGENIRKKVRALALEVVHIQNANGTLTIWPIVALAILQTLNEFLSNSSSGEPLVINLDSLAQKSETFLRLFQKCCGLRIWRRGTKIEAEILAFVRLHKSHLTLSPSGDSVQLTNISPDDFPPLLLNSILLANQANPFVHKLAPFCLGAIVRLSGGDQSGNYCFLQRLFNQEFVHSPAEFVPLDQLLANTNTSDLWALAQILKPFLIAYHSIFVVLLTNCPNALLTAAELTRIIHRKLFEMVRHNAKVPMQIACTDIVKNALSSLNGFRVTELYDERRVRLNCAELPKFESIRSSAFSPLAKLRVSLPRPAVLPLLRIGCNRIRQFSSPDGPIHRPVHHTHQLRLCLFYVTVNIAPVHGTCGPHNGRRTYSKTTIGAEMKGILGAKLSQGVLSTTKKWHYLDRFCFVSKDGNLQYTVQYPKSFELQSIYLYYDANSQWKVAYGNNSLDCRQRERLLDPQNHQIIRLSPNAQFIDDRSKCEEISRGNNDSWIRCHGIRSFFSMRPRWWYLAVGNCDSEHGLFIDYSLLMTNAPPKNRWQRHFSFDQFYSLPIALAFVLLDAAICAVAIVFACMLKSRKMFHVSYRLFLHSLFCEFVSGLFLWSHLEKYADDGFGFPMLRLLSTIIRQFSIVFFVLLLLLVAKGYTITRARISTCSSVKMTLFVTVYLALRLAMLIWEIVVMTYMSESVPAYLIASLSLVAWAWFLRSSLATVKKYPRKKQFYAVLALFATLWYWSGPVVLVVANWVLDNWVREEVVLGVDSAVVAVGFIVFLALTSPLTNNRFFPFHVRTNQIGVNWNNFPHNVYEVQYTSGSPIRTVTTTGEPMNGF
uniref:Phospholipid/glycerol acyltransferase domain-containing protein n=1 Tax=Globodera rostochiensis TaxID=31243 RepID=A0A914I7W2_GLORO